MAVLLEIGIRTGIVTRYKLRDKAPMKCLSYVEYLFAGKPTGWLLKPCSSIHANIVLPFASGSSKKCFIHHQYTKITAKKMRPPIQSYLIVYAEKSAFRF
jgi:hypothetical protein